MDGSQFDNAVRRLMGSRRSLLGDSLAAAAGWLGVAGAGAKKKRKQKRKPKKPKPNAYGCLNVGQPCNGNSSQCCSGICEGNKPKKGKKDASRCAGHDAGICKVDFDFCSTGTAHFCKAGNVNCACTLTTGNAPFCGDIVGAVALCQECSKDTDCQDAFGPGAACVVLGGICEGNCPETGGTVCVSPCPSA